jgi:hypothetical protein
VIPPTFLFAHDFNGHLESFVLSMNFKNHFVISVKNDIRIWSGIVTPPTFLFAHDFNGHLESFV